MTTTACDDQFAPDPDTRPHAAMEREHHEKIVGIMAGEMAQASGQAPAASADLGGLTDAEIDAIWTRPVSATASATVIRRETAELLIRAAALKAAPVAAQPVPYADILAGMVRRLDGVDRNQSGYHHACGWNDALRQAMDVLRANAAPVAAQAQPSANAHKEN